MASTDIRSTGWKHGGRGVAAAAVLIFAGLAFAEFAPSASAQLDLPQLNKRIELSGSAGERLQAVFSGAAIAPTLSPATTDLLVNFLPGDFRDSCAKVLKTIPASVRVGYEVTLSADGDAYWSARLLHLAHEGTTVSAILAFRCTSRNTDDRTHSPYYDERPAFLQLDDRSAALTFIPLAEPCNNCSDLYHVEFVDALPAEQGGLIKLQVISSSENPCCDGLDYHIRASWFWVSLPQAHVVLQVDSRTESDDCDNEGCTQEVCTAQTRDGRNRAGHPTEIVAVTTCTKDKFRKPTETVRYVWQPATARFEKASAAGP